MAEITPRWDHDPEPDDLSSHASGHHCVACRQRILRFGHGWIHIDDRTKIEPWLLPSNPT